MRGANRLWVLVAVWLAACGGGDDGEPFEKLSDWGLFEGTGADFRPANGVVPYDVISPLFMDHAVKDRYIVLPEGGQIEYRDDGPWRMPLGTIVIKQFAYPIDARDPSLGERRIETRLLVLGEEGWMPWVYVWNEEQTEATRSLAGARVPVTWIDEEGREQSLRYRVPNPNQCEGCHGGDDPVDLLGPWTLQLDRDNDYGDGPTNQIDHFAALGMFESDPTPAADRERFADPTGDGPVDERARAYLHANCAHCHRPGGAAGSTGLYLGAKVTDETALGICRRPVAAGGGTGGHLYDIVPGDPDASIMVFRMESSDPEIKMPELPSQLSDATGVAVIREWIGAMDPVDCGG